MTGSNEIVENFGQAGDADTLVSVFSESCATLASRVRVRRGLLACALGLLLVALSAPTAGIERARADRADADLPFSMEPDVVLSPPLRAALTQLGHAFHAAAGRRFHVTSGSRTPAAQARAMFDKLASGGSLTGLYRDYDAARQLEQAYQRARRSGPAACVAAMSRVLAAQMARGIYISRHLHAGAVDVRSRDMSARERRLFRQVVARQRGARVLEEGRPPHFHVEFRLIER